MYAYCMICLFCLLLFMLLLFLWILHSIRTVLAASLTFPKNMKEMSLPGFQLFYVQYFPVNVIIIQTWQMFSLLWIWKYFFNLFRLSSPRMEVKSFFPYDRVRTLRFVVFWIKNTVTWHLPKDLSNVKILKWWLQRSIFC